MNGIGCFCKASIILVEHECCLDGGYNGIEGKGGRNCTTDLNSSQHPCNIKGATWDDKKGPIPPTTSNDKCQSESPGRSCCTNDGAFDENFNRNLPCHVTCGPTYSFFNAANRIKNSGGGRPRG